MCDRESEQDKTGALDRLKEKNKGLRDAEKSRESTCEWADYVAKLVLEKWREVRSREGGETREENAQTVVAGVVAVQMKGERSAKVLAVGEGTKIVSMETAKLDEGKKKVHDSHAEILARRGLLKVLVDDMKKMVAGDEGRILEKVVESGAEAEEMSETPRESTQSTLPRFRLRSDVTLHFYTSTAPCGNSTVRRWGNSKREQRLIAFDGKPFEWPNIIHEKMDLNARKEGQIALSVKRCPNVGELTVAAEVDKSVESPQKRKNGSEKSPFAVGTGDPNEGIGCVLSCSDKMAIWNACGVQGGLLSNFIEPIVFETVVVGRKFNRKHLCRAICCRLQEIPATGMHKLHHPTVLCTGVKVSHAVIEQETKASFMNTRSLAWCESSHGEFTLVLEGFNGTLIDDAIAPISTFSLVEDILSIYPVTRQRFESSGLSKEFSKFGVDYAQMKRYAMELMSSRTPPAFARKRRRPRERDGSQLESK